MKEAVSRAQVLTRMLKGYQAYFDIEQYEDEEGWIFRWLAHCRFYVHSEKYVLVKKAKLWDADSNEYVYIFSVPELTKELYEICKNYAYEDGMKLIDPKPGHMYSYITPVFICDTCTTGSGKSAEAVQDLQKFSFFVVWLDECPYGRGHPEGQAGSSRTGWDAATRNL